MEFLTFLRALSLEPVDDTVAMKIFDNMKFQGNLIDTAELGHELTEQFTRLFNEENGDAGEMEESDRGEKVIFDQIKLPEENESYYMRRRLEQNVVILTKTGSNWRALERELLRRMNKVDKSESEGVLEKREIFAVSWAASNIDYDEATDEEEDDDISVKTNAEEKKEFDCDDELLKVSDVLQWPMGESKRSCSKINHNNNDEDDNMEVDEHHNSEEIMEVDTSLREIKLEKDITAFLDPWPKPPKLRIIELDEIENPHIQFNSLYNIARSKLGNTVTVHWLQAFRKGGFIWKKTRGLLSLSRLKLSPLSYQEEKLLPHLEHKAWQNVICISGVAGMGKTTFLTSVAHELKKMYKTRLICFIDLKKFSDLIETEDTKDMDILVLANLITKYFKIERSMEQSAIKVLISTVEGNTMEPNIELLMDGLDKMSEMSRNVLLKFLTMELYSVHDRWSYRIWITTRPHLKYEIEKALFISAYDLDPVNSADAMSYFMMRNEYSSVEHSKKVYNVANVLFTSSLRASLKIDLGTLLGTPERMAAFEAFMKLNDYEDPFQLNAYLIMRDVIMKNVKNSYIQNYLEKEENSIDKMEKANEMVWKHIPLAIRVSSGENGDTTSGVNMSPQEEADLLNFGIVTKNKEGQFYFIHPAYPAYILAEHYHTRPPDNGIKSDFFLNYVLIKDSCDLIRQFYEESLDSGMNKDNLVEWMNLTRNFLIKTYFLSNEIFDHAKVAATTSVLHLAIIDQRPNLAKLLIRSFAPVHTPECRRLVKRKVRVELSDVRQFSKNKKIVVNGKYVNNMTNGKGRKFSYNRKKITTTDQLLEMKQYVELSTLSLAILLGDGELIKSMYLILGNDGDNTHMEQYTNADNFRFSPLHLAVIGCNPDAFDYLTKIKKMSLNTLDISGHLPMHLLFFNRWILKFPSMGLGNLDVESQVLREVHICKYYEDILNPEWNDRVGHVADRAGHLPLLSSCFVMSFTKMQMKRSLNFSFKRTHQPWKICYYKSYQTYISFAKSLSGRTLINFCDKVDGIYAFVPPPFHLACAAGYIPMIEAMLEKGVKLNIRDKLNRTALYAALCKEQMHVVQFLVEKGIDKDISQAINNIPIIHHLSVQNLKESISYVVQELNVPVDLRCKEGLDNCTPLHMACMGGCLEAAEMLVGLGADVNVKDDEKYTPILHAVHPTSTLNINLIKLLISKGADLNAKAEREENRTCLHQAVLMRNVELIRCLLECGKDVLIVNAVNDEGQSALHLACKHQNNKEILEILIQAGAKVNLQDHMGQTPLFVFSVENHSDTAMGLYLIEQGASISDFNKAGEGLLRQLNKRNPGLGNLIQGAWKSKKEKQDKFENEKKLN